jgi:hypothetical protein
MRTCPSTGMKVSPLSGQTLLNRYQKLTGRIARKFRLESVPVLQVSPGARPLNSIGVPHYNTLLFSSWAPQLESAKVSTAPMKIPLSVLSTMKMNDGIAYAPLPRELKGRRNMITVAARKDQGRFRSEKKRSDVNNASDVTIRDFAWF